MKTSLILILSLLTLPIVSQAYELDVWGFVNDLETGNPVINQEIAINIDNSSSGNFTYFNVVYTNEIGFYSDLIPVPEGESGLINVSTRGCGIINDITYWFTANTTNLEFNFEIYTDPGNICIAYFDYYQGEQPLSIQFVDYSIGSPTTWYWDFGDGTTSNKQDPLHYYAQEGDYLTILTIECDTCYSEYEMTVRVEIGPSGYCYASFYYNQGTEPLTFEFFDTSVGDIDSWTWDFGDGSVSSDQNPIHTYAYEGTYLVVLFIETIDTCFSYFGIVVWVENDTTHCNAAFNVMLDTLNAVPRTYFFTDHSEGEIESWYWEFGDGSYSYEQNPVHVFNEGGNYDVCLTVNTCPYDTSTACELVSTLDYYNFGGQAFIGNYPINIDSTDDANIATVYLYRKINNIWQYMDQREFWKYGYYWFFDKPEGQYLIKTELNENSLEYYNYAPAYYKDAISWKNARVFTLSNDQQFDVNISFQELSTASSGIGSLSGIIISGQSCNIIQNIDTEHVLVQLFNNAMELIAYTYSDVDGRYEFTGLGMGNYSIKAEYTGRYADETNITLSNAEPSVDNIELTVHCEHILDIIEIITGKQIQVNLPYPDPANDYLNIQINSALNTSGTISIYNLNGNIVHNRALEIVAGSQTISTRVSTLPSGLYSLRISLNNYSFQEIFKIIIIH